MSADPGFDARELDRAYAFLDALPETLYAPTVTFPGGAVRDRVDAVMALRGALLRGELPDAASLPWPDATIAEGVIGQLADLGLPRFCRDEPALADAVILDVLDILGEQLGGMERRLADRLAELQRGELIPEPAESHDAAVAAAAAERRAQLTRAAASWAMGEVTHQVKSLLARGWGPRVRAWTEIHEVFGELGLLLGSSWDLAAGMLRHSGWREARALQQLMASLPRLRELIKQIGRLRSSDDPGQTSVLETVIERIARVAEETRVVRTPLAPTETRGVDRSGDVARMLPTEAVLLTRPVLKRLWYARLAERSLLTYRMEGPALERVLSESSEQAVPRRRRSPRERGPVLVCVDTSGSMHGLPEQLAKALTLEVLRVAHAERRRCYLYAFSGPGQCVEHELAVSQNGVQPLLDFLAMSFHGGTDLTLPLRRAAARLELTGWENADVLLISDGEVAAPAETGARLAEAREQHGLRVHGLLVGRAESPAMRTLCDPLHVFRDWQLLGDR